MQFPFSSLHVHRFCCDPIDTNAYLVVCAKTFDAIIIDPGFGAFNWVQKQANSINLKMILLTHSHWDHIGDAHLIHQTYQIPLYVHPEDALNVKNPGVDRLPFPIEIKEKMQGVQETCDLSEQLVLSFGRLNCAVLELPGHSPGGCAFYFKDSGVLFSGDTLFHNGMGRLDLPGAKPEEMTSSLKKIARLPLQTTVFPGHGEETVLQKEGWLFREN